MENLQTSSSKFRTYLASSRFANLPTVWSQVFVAVLLTYPLERIRKNDPFFAASNFQDFMVLVVIVSIFCSMLYLGGCLLGDAFDAEHDKEKRPERPIPRGVLSPKHVFWTGGLLMFGGWIAGTVMGPVSLVFNSAAEQKTLNTEMFSQVIKNIYPHQAVLSTALTLCILAYAKWHKRSRNLALFLMASCRALLLMSAASFTVILMKHHGGFLDELKEEFQPAFLFYPLAVFFFTFAFTKVAQSEDNNHPIAKLWYAPLFLSGALCFFGRVAERSAGSIVALQLALFLGWIFIAVMRGIPNNKGLFVSRSIAGFCLLDAAFVATRDPFATYVCIGFFVLALLLQKLSPAT